MLSLLCGQSAGQWPPKRALLIGNLGISGDTPARVPHRSVRVLAIIAFTSNDANADPLVQDGCSHNIDKDPYALVGNSRWYITRGPRCRVGQHVLSGSGNSGGRLPGDCPQNKPRSRPNNKTHLWLIHLQCRCKHNSDTRASWRGIRGFGFYQGDKVAQKRDFATSRFRKS